MLSFSNANIQASVMVIAAKAGDEILQQYGEGASDANCKFTSGRSFLLILIGILLSYWNFIE